MIWYFTNVLPWDCMEHGVACMVEKGDGGGSNEMSLGRQGRVSAEARGASGYRVTRRVALRGETVPVYAARR